MACRVWLVSHVWGTWLSWILLLLTLGCFITTNVQNSPWMAWQWDNWS